MSAGMIALDIGFSVVEVIMLCYITHFFLKRKTKRSTDLAVLLIYVLIIEIQTFISVNLPIKVTISMVLWAVVCSIFYRTKLITGIITYAIVTNCVGASEMLMIVFSIGIGNTNMINEWYAYIFNHIISFSMLILIGKILMKIRDDLSWKEEILVAAVMVACLISEAATMSYKDAIGLTFAIWQLIAMILLLFGFFVLWAYLRNSIQIRLQSQNEKQQIQKLQAQYQFYKEKQKEEERVRAIYHDMKNHLLVLQAEPANSPGSQEMIGSLQKQISSYETYYQTNNAIS